MNLDLDSRLFQTLSGAAAACLFAALVALATSALAAPPAEGAASAGSGRPPGPPPEAVAACKGKSAGAIASFTARDGRIFTGVCRSVEGTLAVAPPAGSAPPPRP